MSKSEISFARYFADLPDPRVDRTKWHRLDDILVITLCAVICGADSFEEIERFGDARVDWLKRLNAGRDQHYLGQVLQGFKAN